mgnify:CR=1 FL=1
MIKLAIGYTFMYILKGIIIMGRIYEKGQGLVEYALIIIFIAIVVIIALQLLGPTLGNTFSNISSTLEAL